MALGSSALPGRGRPTGPDAQAELVVGDLQTTGFELHLTAAVLHMRGDACRPQPLQSDAGDALLWNGEIFGGGVTVGKAAWSKCPLEGAQSRLPRLLRARLAALGGTRHPGREAGPLAPSHCLECSSEPPPKPPILPPLTIQARVRATPRVCCLRCCRPLAAATTTRCRRSSARCSSSMVHRSVQDIP